MKNTILVVLLIGGAFAMQAQEKQSLKDLLFSGKLKKDSTGIVRSTDDLSKKIDTSTKKEALAPATNAQAANAPAQQDKNPTIAKTDANSNVTTGGIAAATTNINTADSAVTVAAPAKATPAKSNTRLLKEYTDSVVQALQAETLKSKQSKKNPYYLMLNYKIDTDGQVTFTNVTSTPESPFLQAQVKQMLDSAPLRLNPVTDSNNQAKKVKRKQQISVTKE